MVYDVWRGRWRLVVGDVESESMALVPLDEGEELADEPMVDHESNLMDSLELATTILHRLRPQTLTNSVRWSFEMPLLLVSC